MWITMIYLVTLLTVLPAVHAGTGHHRMSDSAHYSLSVCVGTDKSIFCRHKYNVQLQYSTHEPLMMKMETVSEKLDVTITPN
jgi:hypothetical protein